MTREMGRGPGEQSEAVFGVGSVVEMMTQQQLEIDW